MIRGFLFHQEGAHRCCLEHGGVFQRCFEWSSEIGVFRVLDLTLKEDFDGVAKCRANAFLGRVGIFYYEKFQVPLSPELTTT